MVFDFKNREAMYLAKTEVGGKFHANMHGLVFHKLCKILFY